MEDEHDDSDRGGEQVDTAVAQDGVVGQVHHEHRDRARYDALKLTEAMLAGDKPRLLRMLEGLRAEGEAPPRLIWILSEEIRAIARIQAGLAKGRRPDELFRENRVFGDARQSLVGRAAHRLPRESLLQALGHAAFIDRVAKGVAKGDAWDEMLQLGLRLA